ncbi:ABC transporter ATP-binding protein [uncultured Clostridium sp.]|uniref:ABC transporter ATP-binding protein n=1 Tax=uncultured Clostridium sp. TaxID=59620 RepID=UPI0025D37ACB|nr:ABC transporter ATP-binding protein [uncultured Clostridium sp.]
MLQTKDLVSGYEKVNILQGVNININKGEIVSVIGRNGVGKSTLVKTLCGLLKVNGGKIMYKEKNITGSKAYERAWDGISYVPQGHMVFPNLTVEENLQMGESIRPLKNVKPNYDLVYEYFPRLKERRDQMAGTMSGGEQAMLSIGRVLTGNSELMLLDEPSEGVQPNIVQQIGDIILRINKDLGLTVLLVEQHIGLIQQISQRGYAMDKGTIIDSLTSENLKDYNIIKKYLSV